MRPGSFVLAIALLHVCERPAPAYSVLSHEEIIDRNWAAGIKPLLLKRFPQTTEEQLREAHAHAYGGAILQDMGYYPFNSKFFSDLVHYVRSGDYVIALIQESQDVNEYAFALGALAHYAADNTGHPLAVNRAVPMIYPKLRQKYGDEITYEDNPAAHLKTEFGFDVVELARGQYASEAYHDFVGFRASKPLLERAFQSTYSFELSKIYSNLDMALGTYRYSVSKILPELTRTAWSAKKKEIQKLQAGITRRKFVYRLPRSAYEKEWDRTYQRPGLGARLLAWFIHVLPKIGPLRALSFKVPTLDAERLFLSSFNTTSERYKALLGDAGDQRLQLPNENFDTGRPTRRGDYRMADEAYEKLLEQFADAPEKMSAELHANILAFYGPTDPASEKARAVLAALRARNP